MYSKLDNKQKATILEIADVANILAEAPVKLAEGLQYFLQVNDNSNFQLTKITAVCPLLALLLSLQV